MTGATRTTHMTQVATVFVPVADQDRALSFYVDTLGFEKRADFVYGESHRWIEVAPPGSMMALALVPPSEGRTVARDATLCALVTDSIEADHASLRARGVDSDPEIARTGKRREGLISLEVRVEDPVPAQFFFRDTDGNRFLVVQPE